MAQLGSGNGSSYPQAIDTIQVFRNDPAASPDSDTRLDAEVVNDKLRAIRQIQLALGANPQGAFGSLAARLQQFIPGASTAAAGISFANTSSVTVTGTVTQTGVPAVLFQLYDTHVPAIAMGAERVTVAMNQNAYTLMASFSAVTDGLLVNTASPQGLYATTFSSLGPGTPLLVPGTAHGLQNAALLYQLYSNQSPAQTVDPQRLTVDPVSFDVVVTFGQPQSGTLILGRPAPNYLGSFTAAPSVTIRGVDHQLGTNALLFQCWDTSTPRQAITPNRLTVDPTNYDVTLSFGQPQSGTVLLCVAASNVGSDFEIRDTGVANQTAVRVFSQGGNLYLQPGTGQTLFVREKTGAVNRFVLDTAVGRFGIGMIPGHALQLSTDDAVKPGGGSWTAPSDSRIKDVVGAFTDGLELLLQLEPVRYRYNGKGGVLASPQEHVGLLAQALQAVAPYMVRSYPGKLNPDDRDNTQLLSTQTNALVYILLNSVKELAARVTSLTEMAARVSTLEAQVQQLLTAQDAG